MSAAAVDDRDEVEALDRGQQFFKAQPPTARDFEVYRLVMVLETPTRVVSRQLGISQTRVMQIVQRMELYLGEIGVQAGDKDELARRLFIVQYQASEKIRHVASQLLKSFEQTIAGTKPRRPTMMRRADSTCADECRYATAIGRLALMLTKLPGSARVPVGLEDVEKREEVTKQDVGAKSASEREEVVAKREGEKVTSPPKEDCSPSLAEEALKSVKAAGSRDVSRLVDELSAEDELTKTVRDRSRARPVQSDESREKFFNQEAEIQCDGLGSPSYEEWRAGIEKRRELTRQERNEVRRQREMQKMVLKKMKRPK